MPREQDYHTPFPPYPLSTIQTIHETVNPSTQNMAKLIEIDGRTGEGGGQVIRIAVSLAALTTQPIRITNIRGNRPRGGGLKNQHVTSIQWLAEATNAQVSGLSVGSKTLTFTPRLSPLNALLGKGARGRHVKIGGSNAASTMLILQAVMPFLIFAAGDAIVLDVLGGTNADFSPSYEYLDQVLLPTLEERWGIVVGRELKQRSWSLGSISKGGQMQLKIHPLQPGQKLAFASPTSWAGPGLLELKTIDLSILAPSEHHQALQDRLAKDLDILFPHVEINPKVLEESGSISRWYILLVAHSTAGIRRGVDVLTSMPKKAKSPTRFISEISQKVCKELYNETSQGNWADKHLQDQIICYQALSDGWSSMAADSARHDNVDGLAERTGELDLGQEGRRLRKEKTHEPFGHGSLHAQTARWVASELLPGLEFYNKGDLVKGIGFST